MKSAIWSHLLRELGCRPQSDSDVAGITPRIFYISIQSIRWLSEIDQRHQNSHTTLEEPVKASLVPEATENHVGKAFLETWCDEHGYPRPAFDMICLEFIIIGQTQRFESVHQIVDNEESVLFHPNRPSAKLKGPSELEIHILQYSNSLSKRDGKTFPKEVVAVRSRTWPSKMESLRRWSRVSGNQYAKKKPQDKPLIQLNELKYYVDTRRPLVDSDEVNEPRGEEGEPVFRPASGYASGDNISDVPVKESTPPMFTLPDGDPTRDNSAELQDNAPSDDPCIGRDSDNRRLIEPMTRTAKDPEVSRGLVMNQHDSEMGARRNGEVHNTSNSQLTPTVLAGSDTLRRDNGLRAVKLAAEHLNETITNVTASRGNDVPGMICDPPMGLKNHNSSVSGEASGAEESQMRARSRGAFQQSVQSGRVRSPLLDTDVSQSNHRIRNPSLLDSNSGVIGCNSIIRDISLPDRSLTQGLEQPREFGIGNTKGDNDDCTARKVSSPGIPGHKGIESAIKESHGLERAIVRKDESPKFTKQFCPAGSPSAVSSPPRNGDNLVDSGAQYTNAAKATSSKEVVESESRKKEPGGSNETGSWDLCQVSDQASRQSSDSEGLPFPDDYWTYDETAKNYFHVDIGDDGRKTKSWYPLEFD